MKEQEANKNETIEERILSFKDIESKDVEWIWYPYLPKGKLVLLMGDPGSGKTFLASYIASIISNGDTFYNSSESTERGIVFLQNGEDGVGDTIKKRLESAGANLYNVKMINEEKKCISLQNEKEIREILEILHPKLVIFDPLTLYIGKKVDTNSANDIRTILNPISRLCDEFNTTIILVMHLNKSDSKDMYKALGSIDFMAIARSALLITESNDNKNERLLIQIKSSLSESGDTLAFTINEESCIEWLGTRNIDLTKTNFISKTKQAEEMILETLYNGEIGGKELEEEITKTFQVKTFQNARSNLSKKGVIEYFKKDAKTYWHLKNNDKEVLNQYGNN